eukprot:587651-Pyramimonas_sp.AAC.1
MRRWRRRWRRRRRRRRRRRKGEGGGGGGGRGGGVHVAWGDKSCNHSTFNYLIVALSAEIWKDACGKGSRARPQHVPGWSGRPAMLSASPVW